MISGKRARERDRDGSDKRDGRSECETRQNSAGTTVARDIMIGNTASANGKCDLDDNGRVKLFDLQGIPKMTPFEN